MDEPKRFFARLEAEAREAASTTQGPRTVVLLKCLEIVGAIVMRLPVEPKNGSAPISAKPEEDPRPLWNPEPRENQIPPKPPFGSTEDAKDLLVELREIFKEPGLEHIRTTDLIDHLRKIGRWQSLRSSNLSFASRQVSQMLATFGISPELVREYGKPVRAYRRQDLESAFAKHLDDLGGNGRAGS